MAEDCRECALWERCPCGKAGHENGTSVGYSIGECKMYDPIEIARQYAPKFDKPVVDMVEVVRCKDCKYFVEIMTARFRDGTTKEVQICKKRVPLKGENFYCGWGERKESDVYCDRNLCAQNEYNGIECDECQEKRRESDGR